MIRSLNHTIVQEQEGTAKRDNRTTSLYNKSINARLDERGQSPSQVYPPHPVRMWFNTLLEFHNGKTTILRSYSVPAKESDIKRVQKKPKPLKKTAKVKQSKEVQEEVY